MRHLLCAAVLVALSGTAHAIDWKPSGEFGLVITSGNSDTSNVNGKFAVKGEDERWLHDVHLLALRGEIEDEVSANRYEVGARSGYKSSDRSYLFGALRYENDDFAPFEYQTVGSVGWGWFAVKSEPTSLLFEIGPGYRRAKQVGGETEGDGVLRGFMDFKHRFNASTEFFDTFLVEAASDNTFAQNDIGVLVTMSASLALKAALQVRHNTDGPPGTDSTDTLTTINVVWTPE